VKSRWGCRLPESTGASCSRCSCSHWGVRPTASCSGVPAKSVAKSVSSFVGGPLSDRYGRRRPILAGWTLYAAVYLGFAFARSPWQMWLLFSLYGLYYGLTESPQKALVIDLVDEAWRGRALGTFHAVVGVAALPASVIFGVLYQHLGPRFAFEVGAALAILAALVLPTPPAAPVRDEKSRPAVNLG
jgi:MFS family permease